MRRNTPVRIDAFNGVMTGLFGFRWRWPVKPARVRDALVSTSLALASLFTAPALVHAAPPRADGEPKFAPLVSREEAVVISVRALGIPGDYGGFDENGWKDAPPPDPFSGRPEVNALSPAADQTLASGFIVDADGWALTNAHAVVGSRRLRVRLADGRELSARIAGYDLRTDVALLRVDGVNLPAARIGDARVLAVGDWVFSIGAPFGLDRSVTAGIVSAHPRFLPGGGGVPMIQTDVAINPGSSGSPLFNLQGEVVGINSMMLSASGGYEGVSLALPIELAMQVATELRDHGHVRRSHLGAQVQEVTSELARSFSLERPMGALVLAVKRGGPADRAGLHTGDIVLGVTGAGDRSYEALQQAVASAPPGIAMRLDVWRRGQPLAVALEPELLPDPVEARVLPLADARPDPRLGLAIEALTSTQRAALRVQGGGIAVRSAQGAAREAGVRSGDVILAVNDVTVADVDGFDRALAAAVTSRRAVAFLIQRGSALGYLAVEADDSP
jgi:serine protease Do